MIETILGIFTSGGFGALTGLIGGYLQKKQDLELHRLEFEMEKERRAYDLKELEIENAHVLAVKDKEIDIAEAETAMRVSVAEAGAFTESIRSANLPTGVRWVDAVRGLMRPLITTYLLVVTSVLAFSLHKLVGGLESGIGADAAAALYADIIHQIVFLTVTAVSWWFASRGRKV